MRRGGSFSRPDQLAERDLRVGVGDDDAGADHLAGIQLHADHHFPFEQDPLHAGLEPDLAPGALQRPDKGARQRERSAQRIVPAVEIMIGDARMEERRDLRRRHAVIARLPCQHAAQDRVADVGVDEIRPGGARPLQSIRRA